MGLALMLIKFLAWWITLSNAILSDALESIINVVAGAFALYSLILSAKPKDENHPYGHGKIEALSAGFEGGLIAIAGIGILLKGSYHLFYPQAIQQIDLGLWLTLITSAANAGLGWFLKRQGTRTSSLVLEANGKHLLSDAYSSIGLLIGLTLVYFTGWAWVDNVMTIVFGLIILVTGYRLVRRAIAGIMDETDYNLLLQMVAILNRYRTPNWIDIHNFRIIKYGTALHFDGHLILPWYFTVKESYAEVAKLEQLLEKELDQPLELFFHIDPCKPSACPMCQKTDCTVRNAPFEQRPVWTIESVTATQFHGEVQ